MICQIKIAYFLIKIRPYQYLPK